MSEMAVFLGKLQITEGHNAVARLFRSASKEEQERFARDVAAIETPVERIAIKLALCGEDIAIVKDPDGSQIQMPWELWESLTSRPTTY